jgi:hypothetical protein
MRGFDKGERLRALREELLESEKLGREVGEGLEIKSREVGWVRGCRENEEVKILKE